jgi:hypothetical protein
MAERIGDFLIRIGAMKKPQVEEVLEAQKAGDSRSFGAIAIERGYVNEAALKKFVDSQG